MQIESIQQNQPKFDKKMIKPAIKICGRCGDISIHIQNYGVFYKDCKSFFDVEGKFHE